MICIKTGELLRQLIEIANVQKTDFALSMHMTPSGLSKILTGKRLPVLKEKKLFCRQTAHYFAEAIYCDSCFYRFRNLYPILFDFNSRYELEMFLNDAVDNAMTQDYTIDNNENVDFPDHEVSYIGAKSILNNFCITLSNHVSEHSEAALEFFCALPLMDKSYQDIFERVRIINPRKQKNLTCRHYSTIAEYTTYIETYRLRLLDTLVKAEQFGNLSLWITDEPSPHPYLFLRNHFEFHFSVQIDGTPIMTLIRNKIYLFELYNHLMKMNIRKLSYSGREAVDLLGEAPSMIGDFMKRKVQSIYNFLPIGYLLREDDLSGTQLPKGLMEAISKALVDILEDNRMFYITSDALLTFLITGKIMFPGAGAVTVPTKERVPCIERYNVYANTDVINRVRVIRRELPRAAILCMEGASIVYMVDSDGLTENFILFPSDVIANVLAEEINSNHMNIQEYNEELWCNYINKISSDALRPCH